MIGDNYGQVGWPQCGEIDMVEVYGQPGWDADSTARCVGNNDFSSATMLVDYVRVW